MGPPGADADPTADRDGDGWADWVEVAADTDPSSDLSFPEDANGNGVPDVFEGPPGADADPDAVAAALADDADFRAALAGDLATDHADDLRGPPGADADPQAIATNLLNDTDFTGGIAAALAADYANQLRGPKGETGPPGPLPAVALGGGLQGDGTATDPLAVVFGSSGTAATAARADHLHDDRYLQLSALSETDATTLTGGGNADLLHTHAAATSPWFECGTLWEMHTTVPSCELPNFPTTDYAYGFRYNGNLIRALECSTWNRGIRYYNRDVYMVSADNPTSGMYRGGTMWYAGTDATDDDSCEAGETLRHRYWYITNSGTAVVYSGNGCHDPTVYCRELM